MHFQGSQEPRKQSECTRLTKYRMFSLSQSGNSLEYIFCPPENRHSVCLKHPAPGGRLAHGNCYLSQSVTRLDCDALVLGATVRCQAATTATVRCQAVTTATVT